MSLFLPWSKWGVEKRRARRGDRVVAIKEARWIADLKRVQVAKHDRYRRIRHLLSAEVVELVEAPMPSEPFQPIEHIKHAIPLLDEIGRIEREVWKLL